VEARNPSSPTRRVHHRGMFFRHLSRASWCCAPAMHRSSRGLNARSRTCESECGEHNQIVPERSDAEAQGHSEQSIDAVAKAIARFEAYTRYKDFKAFHIEQARAFKRHLAEQRSSRSGEPLSKATLYATLTALKRLFIWLAGQPGYKSRITYADAEYFNLSAKDTRIAKASRPARVPTLEQIRHVIRSMPATTDIERRDRALIAFTILTGARDGAVASFKLRHADRHRSTRARDPARLGEDDRRRDERGAPAHDAHPQGRGSHPQQGVGSAWLLDWQCNRDGGSALDHADDA
jgi:hypothetical protein